MKKGRIKQIAKGLGLLLIVLGFLQAAHWYAVLHPEHFFDYTEEFGSFSIYSSVPISPELEVTFQEVSERVESSEVHTSDSLIKTIFANDGLYFTLAGKSKIPRTTGNRIVLGGELDIDRNRLVLPVVEMNLVYVLTHEAVHAGQHKHHGIFMGSVLDFGRHPSWKTEGYAEWIAQKERIGQDSDSIKNALTTLEAHSSDQWVNLGDGYTMPWNYLRARIMVEYLINVEGMGYSDMMEAPISELDLWGRILQVYKPVQETPTKPAALDL